MIISHKIEKNEQINGMELDILSRDEIPALLPIQTRRILQGKEFRLVVENMTDLRTFLKSDIRFDCFVLMVSQVVEAIRGCESHGIRCDNLELSLDLSFYDYSCNQVRMIYWPLISLNSSTNIAAYLRELGSAYIARGKGSRYRLKYLQFFDSRAKFELDAFRMHLDDLMKQWDNELRNPKDAGSSSANRDPSHHNAPRVNATLERVSNHAKVQINRFPFTVGRKREFCDYAIEDDTSISTQHLTISLRDGRAYIRDNGSVNGTRINDKPIPPNTNVLLPSGASIRIGRQELIYREADN